MVAHHNLKYFWLKLQVFFLMIHYCLLISSLLASLLIVFISAYYTGLEAERAKIILYSTVSFFSLVADKIINPYGLGKAHRKAFDLLNETLLLQVMYSENRQKFNEKIVRTIIECEKIISSGFY